MKKLATLFLFFCFVSTTMTEIKSDTAGAVAFVGILAMPLAVGAALGVLAGVGTNKVLKKQKTVSYIQEDENNRYRYGVQNVQPRVEARKKRNRRLVSCGVGMVVGLIGCALGGVVLWKGLERL